MAEGVKHDYHLVNPSPWPLVGSIAATVMAMGGVAWMKGLFGLPSTPPGCSSRAWPACSLR